VTSEITVATGGVRLAVRRWAGAGASGTPFLLVHGLASTSHIWDLVAPILSARGGRVAAYDQRGHGRSSKPSSGYGFDRTTADALAVIDAVRFRRPVVVGHSWGASVALALADRAPRRVGGAVLLDGGFSSLRERMDWPTTRRQLAPPDFAGMPVDAFVAGARTAMGRSIRFTPQIETAVRSLVRVDRAGGVHPRLSRANHVRILRAPWAMDAAAILRRVRVPTLVLAARTTGDRGPFAREKARAATDVRAIGGHVRSNGSTASTTYRCNAPRPSRAGCCASRNAT